MAKIPKYQSRKMSIADLVSSAHGDLSSLGEELREWADNIEEKFPSKYEKVDEAASQLEDLEEPEVPEALGEVEIECNEPVRTPSQLRRLSRADRRDDAAWMLAVVLEYLDNLDDDEKKRLGEEAVDKFRDAIDEYKDNAEAVEFPGMYG